MYGTSCEFRITGKGRAGFIYAMYVCGLVAVKGLSGRGIRCMYTVSVFFFFALLLLHVRSRKDTDGYSCANQEGKMMSDYLWW